MAELLVKLVEVAYKPVAHFKKLNKKIANDKKSKEGLIVTSIKETSIQNGFLITPTERLNKPQTLKVSKHMHLEKKANDNIVVWDYTFNNEHFQWIDASFEPISDFPPSWDQLKSYLEQGIETCKVTNIIMEFGHYETIEIALSMIEKLSGPYRNFPLYVNGSKKSQFELDEIAVFLWLIFIMSKGPLSPLSSSQKDSIFAHTESFKFKLKYFLEKKLKEISIKNPNYVSTTKRIADDDSVSVEFI